jgi:hypothetical protein
MATWRCCALKPNSIFTRAANFSLPTATDSDQNCLVLRPTLDAPLQLLNITEAALPAAVFNTSDAVLFSLSKDEF